MSGIIDPLATPTVLSLALALGLFTEAIAGVLHFMRGETFAGMVFTTYAGFWLSYALYVVLCAVFYLAALGAFAGSTGLGTSRATS